jgi:hypothetical protein
MIVRPGPFPPRMLFAAALRKASPPLILQGTFLLIALLCLAGLAQARAKEHFGDGFLTSINHPASEIVDLVRSVAGNGVIGGTYEYQGTNELDGAESVKDSDAFPKWTNGGTVFYKIRANTLAPVHFYESNDEGTVVVRYVVKSTGPNSCSLRIDAVFQEDTHHHHHPSDGQVEANEFEVIAQRIKDLEILQEKRREMEARKRLEQQVQDLEAQLDHEKAHLADLNKQEGDLGQQVQQAQGARPARVQTDGANLKADPYNASRTLKLLNRGDAVTVLLQTPGWFQVRTGDGQVGWIFRLMLEVAP